MSATLVTWLGDNDLAAAEKNDPSDRGSVGDFLAARGDAYPTVLLLHNRPDHVAGYQEWLGGFYHGRIRHLGIDLPAPHDFDAVYDAVTAQLPALFRADGSLGRPHYLLSSGTKAMTAALMLLAGTSLPGRMFFNHQRRPGEDTSPAARILEVHWQEKFNLSIWLRDPSLPRMDEPVPGCDSRSRRVRDIYRRVTNLATHSIPVLILGETGTGKERLARHLHAQSGRSGPFVAVNCGAIPESLIESELFGHVRGAFTGAVRDSDGAFQRADGGTLLLDEVADLPPRAQVSLLRALQERQVRRVGGERDEKVDVRIVAATHRDLRDLVRQERFRADLYYRLAGYVVTLPPLRERPGDIRTRIERLRREYEELRGDLPLRIDEAALDLLAHHDWPGNFRELDNVLRRCFLDARELHDCLLVTGQMVRAALGEQSVRQPRRVDPAPALLDAVATSDRSLTDHLADLKRRVIELAIRRHGSQRKAAAALGLKPQAVSEFLKRHGGNDRD